MKKIRLVLALLCAALLMMPLSASAAAVRLVDGADILTPAEESALTARLDGLSEKYGLDVAVLTVDKYEGKSVQAYADDLYKTGGYRESGILLVIAMNTREYAFTANGEAYDIFSEMDMTSLENAVVPHLSDNDFDGAFAAYADKCEHILKYENRLSPVWIIVALLIGVAVASIVIWLMVSKHKSVRMQRSADSYMRRDTFRLDRSRDVYLYSHVSRVAKPKSSSSSGGRSSGGGSRGRSGRF